MHGLGRIETLANRTSFPKNEPHPGASLEEQQKSSRSRCPRFQTSTQVRTQSTREREKARERERVDWSPRRSIEFHFAASPASPKEADVTKRLPFRRDESIGRFSGRNPRRWMRCREAKGQRVSVKRSCCSCRFH